MVAQRIGPAKLRRPEIGITKATQILVLMTCNRRSPASETIGSPCPKVIARTLIDASLPSDFVNSLLSSQYFFGKRQKPEPGRLIRASPIESTPEPAW